MPSPEDRPVKMSDRLREQIEELIAKHDEGSITLNGQTDWGEQGVGVELTFWGDDLDVERGLIFVRGAVPGAEGGFVLVRDAAKGTKKDDLPFPAALKGATGEAAPAAEPAAAEEQKDA